MVQFTLWSENIHGKWFGRNKKQLGKEIVILSLQVCYNKMEEECI